MKRPEFKQRLEDIGVTFVVDVDRKHEIRPAGRSRRASTGETYEPNPTGYVMLKKVPPSRTWCGDCNQLVEGRTETLKMRDDGSWQQKCYCGYKKVHNICPIK